MIELAMNTKTAASTMGSQSEASETMGFSFSGGGTRRIWMPSLYHITVSLWQRLQHCILHERILESALVARSFSFDWQQARR